MLGIRDVILTVCSVAFAYALVPQVIHGFREKVGGVTIQTAVVTGVALFAVAGVYFSLGLWFAATACVLNANSRSPAPTQAAKPTDAGRSCSRVDEEVTPTR